METTPDINFVRALENSQLKEDAEARAALGNS
jgi:hypothetical protein